MRWEEKNIGEVAEIYSGYAFKSVDMIDNVEPNSYPVVKIKNVNNRSVSKECDSHLPESAYKSNYSKYILNEGDILVAMTGQGSVGRIGKMREIDQTYLVNQRVGILRVNENSAIPEFIYQQISNVKAEKYYYDLAFGAGQPNLSPTDIGSLKINLPPLPTQRKIASILSAYDDLIENNLKRIKLLEEKAFLRYKGIVREEKLDKHILSNFGDIITGKTPSTAIADYFGEDVPFIKTPDMHNQIFIEHTNQMLSELGAKSQEKKFLPPFSLCVSCIGTAGVVGITSKPSQTNQQINAIVFSETKNIYFFYSLMSQMKEQLDALGSNGSTFTNVNKDKFENMEVLIPNQKVLSEFAEEFESTFNLILTLQKQNTKLREARDILLPKLMNGQIEA
jgi:type I restriction enzyme S subunit